MSKMLRNTRDAFLKPNAVMKAVLGAVGVLPTELQRGAIGGSFRQPLLAGHAARVVSRALPNTVWWHSDLLGACAGTGAPRFETDAKSPQRVVIDATNVPSIDAFSALVLTQIQPLAKALPANSRVVVLHAPPTGVPSWHAAAVTEGIEGFVRSFAKEAGAKGTTVNMVVAEGASLASSSSGAGFLASHVAGPVGLLLTPDAAYVTGQVIRVGATAGSVTGAASAAAAAAAGALAGRTAIVTGAARGIGAAIAARLRAEGADVLGIDREMTTTGTGSGGSGMGALHALSLDITAPHAAAAIAEWAATTRTSSVSGSSASGVDIVVHNAGITRDKTLRNMTPGHWESVMAVNYNAISAINDALGVSTAAAAASTTTGAAAAPPAHPLLVRPNGRVVVLSSINGIAGAFGQTNYATTKAALIGYVRSLAQQSNLTAAGITVNGVAPGFIETDMTLAMPTTIREMGRRSNALKQGGLPEDVASIIAGLCLPSLRGVTGQVVRVCGSSLVGR